MIIIMRKDNFFKIELNNLLKIENKLLKKENKKFKNILKIILFLEYIFLIN